MVGGSSLSFYTNVHQWGNTLLVRSIVNGRHKLDKINFKPSVWTTQGKGDTEYKTLDGRPCYEIQLDSIKEARDFVERYKDVAGFEIHGQLNWMYQWLWKQYPSDIQWDMDQIRIYSLDIETSSENGFPSVELANEEVLLISLQNNHTKEILTWGSRPYTGDATNFTYKEFKKESDMLIDFVDWWKKNTPDVITGWNINFFDIPFLYRRIARVIGEDYAKQLSPWKLTKEREVYVKGNKEICYDIAGISQLDFLDLYKKYTYTMQESYRLDNIANVELGEEKLDHSEYATFQEFYTNNWNKFVDYNVHDVVLVDKLEDKMRLIELQLTMAYGGKINYEDVFSQVRMWDMLVHNHLREDNIIIPPKKSNSKSSQYEGAYVKDPLIGMHKWVASFDLNSLYPHLIMQYNISPETLLPYAEKSGVEYYLKNNAQPQTDVAVAANGSCYRKDKMGVFPKIMEDLYRERTVAKKEMLAAEQEYQNTKDPAYKKIISRKNNLQMAMKIALNSAYGAMGNEYFRYFDIRMAEAITVSGQLSIRWIHDKMNEYLNKIIGTTNEDYIIAVDTDSIYVTFEKLIDKVFTESQQKDTAKIIRFMDQICEEKFQPFIDKCYVELAKRMNAYDQKMNMKREVLADKGIWTAKKRYVLSVHNSEGVQYAEPKLKVMGLEMIKSSTPQAIREALRDALPVILHKTQSDLYTFINEFREKYNTLSVEDIAFPRSVNGIKTYGDPAHIYTKGTPFHCRGALVYNHHLKDKKLTNRYPLIKEGEKIKYVFLKVPNTVQENVISFISELPKELDLHKYIDYDMQFEKSFLDALQIVVEPLKWKVRETASLEDFF